MTCPGFVEHGYKDIGTDIVKEERKAKSIRLTAPPHLPGRPMIVLG